MTGKKGRSGRQKRAIELARARGKDDALSCVRRRLPQILEVLVQKAEAGDKECAVYCVDRVLGRPRIELDQRMKSEVDMTIDPSKWVQALRELEENRDRFMSGIPWLLGHGLSTAEREPSDPGLQNGGTTQGTSPTPPDASDCADIP